MLVFWISLVLTYGFLRYDWNKSISLHKLAINKTFYLTWDKQHPLNITFLLYFGTYRHYTMILWYQTLATLFNMANYFPQIYYFFFYILLLCGIKYICFCRHISLSKLFFAYFDNAIIILGLPFNKAPATNLALNFPYLNFLRSAVIFWSFLYTLKQCQLLVYSPPLT